ncbi:hypothetical protein [Bradyrhizobium oligotrophicum]|uniref:hypothetical protein n=1 Tax=Bradyrhizobium oligotrophicum TaxID=44255 RepID=UPI003EB9E4A9
MAELIEAGISSETRWILPNGFGSLELPPEAGGLPLDVAEVKHSQFSLRPGLELYTYEAMVRSPFTLSYEVLTGNPYLWLAVNFSGQTEYSHGGGLNGVTSGDRCYCAILRDPLSKFLYVPADHRTVGLAVSSDRLNAMLQGQRPCRPIDGFLDGQLRSSADGHLPAVSPPPFAGSHKASADPHNAVGWSTTARSFRVFRTAAQPSRFGSLKENLSTGSSTPML